MAESLVGKIVSNAGKQWSRNTVADGYWLNSNTVQNFNENDKTLAEAIESVSAAMGHFIPEITPSAWPCNSNQTIQTIEQKADGSLNVVYQPIETYSTSDDSLWSLFKQNEYQTVLATYKESEEDINHVSGKLSENLTIPAGIYDIKVEVLYEPTQSTINNKLDIAISKTTSIDDALYQTFILFDDSLIEDTTSNPQKIDVQSEWITGIIKLDAPTALKFLIKGDYAQGRYKLNNIYINSIGCSACSVNVIKDHIKSEYPIEIKSSASGTYVTFTLDGKVVFVAEYGKTTYSEILEHIERKDILTLNVNGTDYCTNYNIGDSFIEFYNTSVVNGVSTTKRYILNSNNEWTFTTDPSKKLMSSLGSINVNDDGIINIGCSKKVIISAPSLYVGTDSIEGSLSNLVYKDIVKNVNSDVPVVLFGTNKSDQIQTNSSIPNMSGMITFFAGYDPSMGPIINYVNNNVSKLKVLMKNDVTYDSINTMFSASPYLPILNDGTQYYYPHYAAPGYGFSWFNFTFMGKDQTMSQINYYFLSTDNTWSTKSIMIPSEGLDNTDIKTIISAQNVVAVLKTETIDIEV